MRVRWWLHLRSTKWLAPWKFIHPWSAAWSYCIAYTFCLVLGHHDDGSFSDVPYFECSRCGFEVSVMEFGITEE